MSTVNPMTAIAGLPPIQSEIQLALDQARGIVDFSDGDSLINRIADILIYAQMRQRQILTQEEMYQNLLSTYRAKLAAIKIHDHDMDDDTPVTLSFDEVWAMGESREKFRHNQTREALAEVTKQRDALLLAARQLVPVEMTNVQQQLP